MAEERVTYPIVIKLEVPIERGSEVIYELQLQRPKAKHFKKMNMADASMEDALELLSQLSGQPPSVIDELAMEDFTAASEIVGNLFAPSRKTSTRR